MLDFYSYVSAIGAEDYYQGWAGASAGSPQYLVSDSGGNGEYNLYNYNGSTTGFTATST